MITHNWEHRKHEMSDILQFHKKLNNMSERGQQKAGIVSGTEIKQYHMNETEKQVVSNGANQQQVSK